MYSTATIFQPVGVSGGHVIQAGDQIVGVESAVEPPDRLTDVITWEYLAIEPRAVLAPRCPEIDQYQPPLLRCSMLGLPRLGQPRDLAPPA
jgi:hypothetical protein